MFLPAGTKEELYSKIKGLGIECDKTFQRYTYVISRLIHQHTIAKDRYEKKGVAINAQKLAKELGLNGSSTAALLKNLIDWEFIVLHKDYQSGISSRKFKLHSRFENVSYTMVTFMTDSSKLIRKLLEKRNGSDMLLQYQTDVLKLSSVSDEGLNYLLTKYPDDAMKSLVQLYRDNVTADRTKLNKIEGLTIMPEDISLLSFIVNDFYAYRPDSTSRVYTNFCSLKKEHRKYILIGGKPLLNTDIVNSQLLFAIPAAKKALKLIPDKKGLPIPKDFHLYCQLAEKGEIYEKIAEHCSFKLTKENRKDFKRKFFAQVFFSRTTSYNMKVSKAFRELFPSFNEAMANIKMLGHEQFAIACQRQEAQIMIDVVLKQLMEWGIPALSLHDSIYVADDSILKTIEHIIATTLKVRFDINVSFKREGV